MVICLQNKTIEYFDSFGIILYSRDIPLNRFGKQN